MRPVLAGLLLAACSPEPHTAAVVFGGDLAPVRGTASVFRNHPDPWAGLRSAFGATAQWVVNLETAVVPESPCPRADGLCLRLDPSDLERLTLGPFVVLSRANNHATDFGPDSLHILDPNRYPTSATTSSFTDAQGHLWSVVPLDLTTATRATLDQAMRAVSRARATTPYVAAFLHSTTELDPRLDTAQVEAVTALQLAGAPLVVGSGAHVIQTSTCDAETATFAGLGNLWMDQHPAETRTGWALGCQTTDNTLRCTPQPMHHDARHPPAPVGAPGPVCTLPLAPSDRRWQAHPRADQFAQVLPLPAAGPDAFVALWRQTSPFDQVSALRPYVFSIHRPSGGLPVVRDLWRGTALAAPIAVILEGSGDGLCVLHRTDGIFESDTDRGERRWQMWRWSGFGFEPDDQTTCP